MNAEIISRVSQILLEQRLGYKLPKSKSANNSAGDSVQISSVASEANAIASALDREDEQREAEVKAIREKVQSGNYKMSEKVIDEIAAKIAKMFV